MHDRPRHESPPTVVQRRLTRVFLALIVLGVVARVALAAISYGSLDAKIWESFARGIHDDGLLKLYAERHQFNHPPIPGLWAAGALRISGWTGLRFQFVFKLPMIAADALACWLLWRAWRERGASPVFAMGVATLFAWNLDSILIAGHHCNTDPIYAMLALASVYLAQARRAHFASGLALAAAINVKLIPVLLILPMIAAFNGRRNVPAMARFLGGLSVGVLPFIVVLIAQGAAFARNALAYASGVEYWGFNYFLRTAARQPKLADWAKGVIDEFHDRGRFVMILAIALAMLHLRRRSAASASESSAGFDRYSAAAVAAALFLVLTSGFGYQYTVFVGPLLLAVRPLCGAMYGLLSGMYLLTNYWLGWFGGFPIDTTLAPDPVAPGPLFGLLAWATLVVFVYGELRGMTKPRTQKSE